MNQEESYMNNESDIIFNRVLEPIIGQSGAKI
jgi:hypothetical protein